MAYQLNDEYRLAFPTLIAERSLPEAERWNPGLREAIVGRSLTAEGLQRSNEGGWHSALDFFKWREPEAVELAASLRAAIKDYWATEQGRRAEQVRLLMQLEGWAMIYERGDASRPHVHPNSHVSGVYYVDAGSEAPGRPHSGALSLLDPRNRPFMFETHGWRAADTFTLTPRAGLLVLFPAWVYHYVHPYAGEGQRIAIAFNATIHKTEPIDGAGRDSG